MKRLFIYFILSLLVFNGCSVMSLVNNDSPQVLIKKDFEGSGIAVLTFAKQGSSLPYNIGKTSADKLADALFLTAGYNVIDRSQINSAQQEMEIENVEFMSADQLQQIGLKLKANYLILGRIQALNEKEYFNVKFNQELALSFRIISVRNTDVVGVADYKVSTDENVSQTIDKMIKKMVNKMSVE